MRRSIPWTRCQNAFEDRLGRFWVNNKTKGLKLRWEDEIQKSIKTKRASFKAWQTN